MTSGLFDLIDRERWLRLQERFYVAAGIGLRLVDRDGVPLTALTADGRYRYCCEIVGRTPMGGAVCRECPLFTENSASVKNFLRREHRLLGAGGVFFDECQFFINRIITAVTDPASRVRAYVLMGPLICDKRKSYAEYVQLSKTLGCSLRAVVDGIERTRLLPCGTAEAFAGLAREIAGFFVSGTGDGVPETAVSGKSFFYHKILQALFETAGDGIDAERASLMLLDDRTGRLHIVFSRGLDRSVVEKTHLELGQGVAGWVAQRRHLLFIDRTFREEGVCERLSQPDITAALLVPVTSRNRIVGVLNLSTRAAQHEFTPENIHAVGMLARFLDKALSPLE